MYLTGDYPLRLDDKGRVILPSGHRDVFEGAAYVTRGRDHCVELWPTDAWEAQLEELLALPTTSRANRRELRIKASAHRIDFDGQSRVLVPQRLREYAELDRDLMVIGAVNHVEIWDRTRYEEWMDEAEQAYATQDDDA